MWVHTFSKNTPSNLFISVFAVGFNLDIWIFWEHEWWFDWNGRSLDFIVIVNCIQFSCLKIIIYHLSEKCQLFILRLVAGVTAPFKYCKCPFLWLCLEDSQASAEIIYPPGPQSAPWPPPSWMGQEHLPWKALWKHPQQMSKPPQTPPFYVNEQQLCSRLLTDGWAFYHISKEDTGQPQERTFQPCRFYSWACSVSQGLLLMVMGESGKEGQPADRNLCVLPSSFFVTTMTVAPWTTPTTPGKHPSSWRRRCGLQLKHLASVLIALIFILAATHSAMKGSMHVINMTGDKVQTILEYNNHWKWVRLTCRLNGYEEWHPHQVPQHQPPQCI